MVLDINDELSHIRARRLAEIQEQIRAVDRQMLRLTGQKDAAEAAQQHLAEMEAILLRMSMLAREAAAQAPRRPGLLEEFEDCKLKVAALLEQVKTDALALSETPHGMEPPEQ